MSPFIDCVFSNRRAAILENEHSFGVFLMLVRIVVVSSRVSLFLLSRVESTHCSWRPSWRMNTLSWSF